MRAKKQQKQLLSLLLIFILTITEPEDVFAQGIAVSPDKLEFFVAGDYSERQLMIYNGNSENLRFRVSADDFADWFSFDKAEGIIAPGSYEKVKVKVSPAGSNGRHDTYVTHITIATFPDSNGNVALHLGASVKATVTIARESKTSTIVGLIVTASIVAVGLLAYLLLKASRQKQKTIYRSYI